MKNNNHIMNYLTFRYDPNDENKKHELKWKYFTDEYYAPDGYLLEKMLESKIQEKLESYDNIAIALSSGIDSQLLFHFIRKTYPEKKIHVIHYEGNNSEFEIVYQSTKETNVTLHVLKNNPVIGMIPHYVNVLQEPVWDAFNMSIFQKTRELECDILVTGDGADEILGGYTFRYSKFSPVTNQAPYKAAEYMACHNRDWVDAQANIFGNAIDFSWEKIINSTIERHFDNPLKPIRQCFMADFNGKLTHNFIPRDSKFSKYFEIENYSPYLEKEVIDYCNHLSSDSKVVGEMGKIPLRHIADRNNITTAKTKIGFTHNVIQEIKSETGKEMKQSLLNKNREIYKTGLINHEWIKRHISNEIDINVINKLLQIYALEWWLNIV